METLNDLEAELMAATFTVNMLSDKLASPNLDLESKPMLVKRLQDAKQKMAQIQNQIDGVERGNKMGMSI